MGGDGRKVGAGVPDKARGRDAGLGLPETFFHYKTITFTPLWYGGPSPLTRTLHGAPHTQALACLSLLYKTAVIPDVTCIMLVHTTNPADKTSTTPILDSTLSPRPPPVDHRGDSPSHTFNIDLDIYLPHVCCIQHRLGYLPVSDSSLSGSSLSGIFACL